MSDDTYMDQHTADTNSGSLLLWILAAILGTLSSFIKDVYPVATFVLTCISIFSFTLICIINFPKAMKVLRDSKNKFKFKKP